MAQPKQKVYFSRTLDGQPGLFTNGVMVLPLDEQEVLFAEEVAKQMGFDYVENEQ